MAGSNKKTLIQIVKVVKATVFVAVLALAAISILTILPINFPLKPYVVLTGSMNPTIPPGSVSFVNRGDLDIKSGDVITFIRPDDFSQNVTHRVVGEERDGNQVFYKTKGDANNTEDSWQVKRESVWGKVAFSLPFIGFAVNFARTRLGVILLIVLPLVLIALDEMRVTHREVKKIRQGRRDKKAAKEKESTMSAEAVKKAAMILLVAGFSLLSTNIGHTLALFNDSVSVTNNVVTTGYWVAPVVSLVDPNGGANLYHNNNYLIRWSASTGNPTDTILIDLYYSTDGGSTFPNDIVTGLVQSGSFSGSYNWTVPGDVFSDDVVIKVVASSHGVPDEDVSNSTSSILSPIVLNEFITNPSGPDNALAPDGEYIELWNKGNVPVDVAGWTVRDAGGNVLPISAGNTDAGNTIVPQSYLLTVYRNGDPNFNLDDNVGSVSLFDNNSAPIDSFGYASGKPEGFSFQRIPDGSGVFVDPIPTPGRPNRLNTEEEIQDYILELESGEQGFVSETNVNSMLTPSPSPSAMPTVSPTPTSSQSLRFSEPVATTPQATAGPALTPAGVQKPAPTDSPVPSSSFAPLVFPSSQEPLIIPNVDLPILPEKKDLNA